MSSTLLWMLLMPVAMVVGLAIFMAVSAVFGAMMAFLCGLEDNDDFD